MSLPELRELDRLVELVLRADRRLAGKDAA